MASAVGGGFLTATIVASYQGISMSKRAPREIDDREGPWKTTMSMKRKQVRSGSEEIR